MMNDLETKPPNYRGILSVKNRCLGNATDESTQDRVDKVTL